jgi:hypothetical protein
LAAKKPSLKFGKMRSAAAFLQGASQGEHAGSFDGSESDAHGVKLVMALVVLLA